MHVRTLSELRSLYAAPGPRAAHKQIARLDTHCRRFIALSPFVVLSSSDPAHHQDASPRGGEPGFVKVTDAGQLLIPDAPGNNRLDTLENIVQTGQLGLLFMVPGFDETLRVNGSATLSTDAAERQACASAQRTPRLVIRVEVAAAYLHCAKAFMRSRLWAGSARVDRTVLPTIGQMIADQTGLDLVPETREQMERRYAADL